MPERRRIFAGLLCRMFNGNKMKRAKELASMDDATFFKAVSHMLRVRTPRCGCHIV